MNTQQLVFIAVIALHLGACSSVSDKPADAGQAAVVETRDPANTNAVTGGVESGQTTPALPISMPGLDAPAQKILYFDFDRSDIRADQRAIVDAHARYLLAHPELKVRLEGHADERGSREYNLALGERRAQAVYRYFSITGIAPSRMTTLSYGEEYPITTDHNEASWRQNRRVEITYLSGGF